MVRYWDASAVVAALGTQPDPAGRTALLAEDGQAVSGWTTRVECASALFRLRREEAIDEAVLAQALKKMEAFFDTCHEVSASEEVRIRAIRLLRAHPLRAADALQLAAALVACREEPASLPFVSSDQRLKKAAEREGFTVL
jgi:uncharacterized protein